MTDFHHGKIIHRKVSRCRRRIAHEESAPGMGSPTPRCTPTLSAGFWRTASTWRGSVENFDRLSAHALRVGFITKIREPNETVLRGHLHQLMIFAGLVIPHPDWVG
jgi:hypothetical protein